MPKVIYEFFYETAVDVVPYATFVIELPKLYSTLAWLGQRLMNKMMIFTTTHHSTQPNPAQIVKYWQLFSLYPTMALLEKGILSNAA